MWHFQKPFSHPERHWAVREASSLALPFFYLLLQILPSAIPIASYNLLIH